MLPSPRVPPRARQGPAATLNQLVKTMKILSLRFENLNALYGRWAIDFTHPDYDAEGIFAITGPTGAGKTTILDAICLALYGRTPRLARINRSSNEIMSRQRSHCFAEVVFATQAGRFLCHWSQHRARQQLTGDLQAPKHELSNADTGALLETGPRAVAPAVEALTGLDYERFTRSVLLAQGAFATFLHAGADERAPLLEQITGTEIYAQLSMRVHEQTRLQRAQREEQQRLYEAVEVLSEEAEQEHRQAHQALQQQLSTQQEELERLAAAMTWRERLHKLSADLTQAEQALTVAQQVWQDFGPQQERLHWAQQCAEFETDYVRWHSAQEQQRRYAEQLAATEAQLPKLQADFEQATQQAASAEQAWQQAQQDMSAKQEIWQRVQALDERLKGLKQWLAEAEKNRQRRRTQIHDALQAQKQAQHQLEDYQRQLDKVEQYQQAQQADAGLEQALEGLVARLTQRDEQHALHREQQQKHELHEANSQQLQQQYDQQRLVKEQQQTALTTLEQSLQQWREQQEQILEAQPLSHWRALLAEVKEQVHLRLLVASLEEHRQRLRPGEACPLCGAKEHPYVHHELPTPDHYETKQKAIEQRVQEAEKLATKIAEAEQQRHKQREQFSKIEQQLLNLEHQRAQSQAQAQTAAEHRAQLHVRLQSLDEQLNQLLQPLGITLTADLQTETVIEQLRTRLQAWRHHQQQQQQLKQHINQQEAEWQRLGSLLDSYQEDLNAQNAQYEQWQQVHQDLQAQRQALFGDKDLQTEQQSAQELMQRREVQWQQARQQALKAERAHMQQLTALQTVTEQHQEQQQRAQQALSQLEQRIQTAGFADLASFEKRRLPTEERQSLAAQSSALEQAVVRAQATCHERAERLAAEQALELSIDSFEHLQAQHQALSQQQKTVQDQAVALAQQLAINNQAKTQRQAHYERLQKQEADYQRWHDLHALIGSADGKKYRNFAQGLSFAQLVYYANQQMKSMSDRYLLLQGVEALSLNVIDNYQGGLVRSTQNLSGGESFIVSLALALGLSKMASQNVRLDSLFLDEGFGTLDDEALGLALDTLASLRQESKLIGVISHVAALKERINTQIQVYSNRRGQSQLQGPGCRQE